MKKNLLNFDFIKIIIGAVLFGISFLFEEKSILYFLFIFLSYIILAYEMFIDSVKKIFKKELFDENLLMIIATISAFCIGEYPEAIMVILLFDLGEYLSHLAVKNSKKSITNLMDLRSDYINLKQNEEVKKVDIKCAKIDDIFVVKPGEKIPLDGIVISGQTDIDSSSLTGESKPQKIVEGDTVLSGCINNRALITVKATSVYETSTASKIIELMEKSGEHKANTEKFITRFARVYTPIVVGLAILITVIPTLLGADFHTWLYRSLVFLVTSCPCALVISVPLGFFCGIGRASKDGVLIKGSSELEKLSKIKTLVLDKTGTLTKGNFEIVEVVGKNLKQDEVLEIMAYAEKFSTHPIATIIVNKYGKKINESKINNFEEISGHGIKVKVNEDIVLVGNEKLMKKEKIPFEKINKLGTIIYLSINGNFEGYIVINDEIKKESYDLTNLLYKENINRVVMLSGDNEEVVKDVCDRLLIKEYYSSLLPIDKVTKLKHIKQNDFTAFIGDGINDAPALKMADLGIAMGGLGSDAAIEAADVVLMNDDLNKVIKAIKISKLTNKVIKTNIIFALSVKLLILILAVFGITTIWAAVFADVGVTLLAILNTLQIFKRKINVV